MSQYLGNGPGGQGQASRFVYIATQGQTVFAGVDSNGLTLSNTGARWVEVALDGRWLPPSDYTVQDASTVVLATAANAGDIVYVYVQSTFSAATALSIAQNGADIADKNAFRNAISAQPKFNYVINGAMMVSQENGATAGSTSAYYGADCFKTLFGNSGALSIAQVASTTPGGSPNRLRLTVTTADAVLDAADYLTIEQHIEGYRIADLSFGGTAKSVVVQFGCKGPASAIYCFAFANAAGNRNYIAQFTCTGADQIVQIPIPGDVAGTWAKDNTLGLNARWSLMVGSTYQGTSNSWITTGAFGTAAQSNFMSTNGNVFELFDVGLYEGTVGPAFKVPDFASELATCQRYFRIGGAEGGGIAVVTLTQVYFLIKHIGMRASPTVSLPAPFGITDVFAANFDQSSANIVISGSNSPDIGLYLFGNFTGLTSGRVYLMKNPQQYIIAFNARL